MENWMFWWNFFARFGKSVSFCGLRVVLSNAISVPHE
jgi:hypothetical protein